MEQDRKKPELTLVRGGKTDVGEFNLLPLADKVLRLRQLPASKKLEAILGDPEGEVLTQALQPQELYWAFKEIGAEDALTLLEYASPEQREFFLDMELWQRDAFVGEKGLEWLGYLMESGEEKLVEQLVHLDLELLILIVAREITVGGGVGELLPDEERTADWDHSFDNLYFITFRNPKHSRLIGTLLDILFRRKRSLYQAVMEGVKNEVESELEEQAHAFRSGRMADLGFPSREEAIFIYARIDPAEFVPAQEKKLLRAAGGDTLPALPEDGTMLSRVLARQPAEELYHELNYLINNALMAEDCANLDEEAIHTIMQRVSGYLNIALEFLCGADEEKAADLVARESFRRLFQLGNGIVQGVRKKAASVTATDYATGKAVNGARAERPRFFRGLDPDGVDGYREFRGIDDVRKMESLLENLK